MDLEKGTLTMDIPLVGIAVSSALAFLIVAWISAQLSARYGPLAK